MAAKNCGGMEMLALIDRASDRIDTLANGVSAISTESTRTSAIVSELKDDIDTIRKILTTGNGKPSVLARLEVLERSNTDINRKVLSAGTSKTQITIAWIGVIGAVVNGIFLAMRQ